MAVWSDVKIAKRDLEQVEFELNRKLRQFFGNINMSQLTGGLPDLNGVLPLSKGGTGQSLSDPTFSSLLFFDIVSGKVDWLVPGNSITILSGILDTIQDIRNSASPIFKNITLTNKVSSKTAQIGDLALGNYIEIDGGFRIFENEVLPDRILFYDSSLNVSDWLYVGDSIVITDNVLDIVQDIRETASPTFVSTINTQDVKIGDVDAGDYTAITDTTINIYESNVLVDTILFSDLGDLATGRSQLDITGIISPSTVINVNSSGANYTQSGDTLDLGVDATEFNGNINTIVQHNGVELIKNSDVVYVSSSTLTFPSMTFDSGDKIIIKGGKT